jgi:hypothetical protein
MHTRFQTGVGEKTVGLLRLNTTNVDIRFFVLSTVNACDGKARSLITEESKTFFCYREKRYRRDVNDGREIVWMSERDGWNHLYL